MSPKNYLLDVRIDDIYEKGIENHLSGFIDSKKFNMITPTNPIMLMISRENPKFKQALNKSELNICDGIGISFMFKLISRKIKRCPGSTLIYDVLKFSEKNNLKIFLLGAKPEINKKTIDIAKKRYPKIKIFGYSPLYEKKLVDRFIEDEQKKIMSLIKKFKPNIICAFLGAPFQEIWFYDNRKELQKIGVKIGLSLGRTADFVSGHTKRSPKMWQKLKLEWLYRLTTEKGRVKKVFPRVPLFVLFSLKDMFFDNRFYKLTS